MTTKQALKKLDKQFTDFFKFCCKKQSKKNQGIWGWTIEHLPTETKAFSTSDFDQIADYFKTQGNTQSDAMVWYKGKVMTIQEFYTICHKNKT